MDNSSNHFDQQVVLSEQEIQKHYRFRLRQVGFSYPEACSTAALMLQAPNDLAQTERASVKYALLILENHRISDSLKVKGKVPVRSKPNRRLQKKFVYNPVGRLQPQHETIVT